MFSDNIARLFLGILLIINALRLLSFTADGSSIGVCYYNQDENLPPAHVIVSMYMSNHIGRMRLYEPDAGMFNALRGSAIQNLHKALGYGGLWNKIKVTTTVSPSVMAVSFPPSAGQFSQSAAEYMEPIAQYLGSIGAPLLANVYPYINFMQNPEQRSLPYALFTANNYVFTDYGLGYRNSFDATIDALYSSLEKAGAPNVRIVVSETGWPSSGNNNAASIYTAQVYNSNLIRHVLSSQGTPKRPGQPIETYIFSLFNERRNFGGTTSESHFGLFDPADMRPVYPIDFQGSGY
ncbi:hypothetical protein AQUCO_00400503v1 [Aquilegia coerulea]|uniref:Glucan endo-1,3-beta-D-glucosidase n=1 Tax=Aquilegia coerulea TaxID=218851 RepID=A0A2G5EVE8_AQUCA|nr:hypothetical protein AQUCO_00400503v1 [Aquilegia coerulea]